MTARRLRCVALALAALAQAVPAAAGEARTILGGDVFLRANPVGVELSATATRRWDIPDDEGPLARGRYAQASIVADVNPAYAQLGLAGEWVPAALLELRARYDVYGFFGTNGALVRFPSRDAPFGDAARRAREETASSGLGHRVLLEPVVRLRAGPVILRSQADLALFRMSAERGWYYESEYDTLLAATDLVVADRTALLLELWRAGQDAVLLAGPAHEITWARGADLTRQRAGVAVFWVPADRALGLERPRLLAYGGVNLVDRNRRGEPFAVIGVGADLDLRARDER